MKYLQFLIKANKEHSTHCGLIIYMLLMGFINYYAPDYFESLGTLRLMVVSSLAMFCCIALVQPVLTIALEMIADSGYIATTKGKKK